ncbi:MAG: DUF5127 domain-containing protein, partial [Bacteroidota bacterium]
MKVFNWITCLLFCQHLVAQVSKAPAYPLLVHNPYFSIWSFTDELNASTTKHWTGANQSLIGLIKVDGKVYRFLGEEEKQMRTIIATADEKNYDCKYTEDAPANGWEDLSFDDGKWKTATAPFGDDESNAKTLWRSKNIWMRRTFVLNEIPAQKLFLKMHHDDNVQVYLDGEKIYDCICWNDKPQYFAINDAIKSKLHKGKNVLAIHCENTEGGAWLDAGLSVEMPPPATMNILMAQQKSADMNATQTIYRFACGGVDLSVVFTSPLLINDLDILSRPVSYVSFKTRSNDGKVHDAQIYFGTSTDLAVNLPSQEVTTQQYVSGGLSILKAGTVAQPVLQKKGDDIRIDWGYVYVAAPTAQHVKQNITTNSSAIKNFALNIAAAKNPATGKSLMLNTVFPAEKTGQQEKEQMLMIGYDNLYEIQFFKQNLRPWWRLQQGATIEKILEQSYKEYQTVLARCNAVNDMIYKDAMAAGGDTYARLCIIAY